MKTADKKKIAKKTTQFTIDLDIKGLILFLMMATLTAIVIFHLGFIVGKASRNPNASLVKSTGETLTSTEGKDVITPSDLEIYDIRTDDDKLSALISDTKSAIKEADQVINEASLYQEETDPAPPSEIKTGVEPPKADSTQWPDQIDPKDLPKDAYTIQVFATKDKDKADRIIRLLRQQQFEAYLAEVTIENQMIYRVRVGKKTRDEIENVNKDLEKVVGGMGMKPRIIKIN